MYLTVKQELKRLTRSEYEALKELSHTPKNMYNVALYNIRQLVCILLAGAFSVYEKH